MMRAMQIMKNYTEQVNEKFKVENLVRVRDLDFCIKFVVKNHKNYGDV